MSSLVVLRAQTGIGVGAGHVRRSRAVAHALRELDVQTLFVVDDRTSATTLQAEGFRTELADGEHSWARAGACSAWVDGFQDFSDELLALRQAHTRTFLVENRTPARDSADLVVYPALHWRPDFWDRAHPYKVLGGARWIPLASEIAELALTPAFQSLERDVDLLVSFGGSDPRRLTERVLGVLDPSCFARVVVSVGWHMSERRAEIEKAAARFSLAQVLAPGSPLGPWQVRSRAAITALGTTLYELAHLGTPAWILANYAEDRRALEHYQAYGPHLPLGIESEIDDARLARRLREPIPREVLGRSPARIDLGGGAKRLALTLLGFVGQERRVA